MKISKTEEDYELEIKLKDTINYLNIFIKKIKTQISTIYWIIKTF